MIRLSAFCFLVFLLSCSTTKKTLTRSFERSFFYDTGYFKITLPLYTKDELHIFTMIDLEERKYVKLVDRRGYRGYAVYEVTDEGKKYLSEIYYDAERDSEYFAAFNYYKLDNVKIDKFHFSDNNRDTIEATLKSTYCVTPLYPVNANPSYTKVLFTRSGKTWQLQDSIRIIGKIYRIDDERWRKSLSFRMSEIFWQWNLKVVEDRRSGK